MEAKPCGCPVIDDSKWHRRTFSWEGRTFYRKEVNFLFRTPMGIEERTKEAAEEIEKRGYAMEDPAVLLVEPGTFKGAVLIGILPPHEKSPDVFTFDSRPLLSVVYRSEEPKLAPGLKLLKDFVSSFNQKIQTTYVWYATCPKCIQEEKKYTTVLIARTA